MTAADRNHTADALDKFAAHIRDKCANNAATGGSPDRTVGLMRLTDAEDMEVAARLLRAPDTPTDSDDQQVSMLKLLLHEARAERVAAVDRADRLEALLHQAWSQFVGGAKRRLMLNAGIEPFDHDPTTAELHVLLADRGTAPDHPVHDLAAAVSPPPAPTDVFTQPPAPELVDRYRADREATEHALSDKPPPAPTTCPTCRSDDPLFMPMIGSYGRMVEACPDSWHQAAT